MTTIHEEAERPEKELLGDVVHRLVCRAAWRHGVSRSTIERVARVRLVRTEGTRYTVTLTGELP